MRKPQVGEIWEAANGLVFVFWDSYRVGGVMPPAMGWMKTDQHDDQGYDVGHGSYRIGSGPFPRMGYDLVKLVNEKTSTASPTPSSDKYPHKCPRCGSPAYLGFSSVECSMGC